MPPRKEREDEVIDEILGDSSDIGELTEDEEAYFDLMENLGFDPAEALIVCPEKLELLPEGEEAEEE